jgi:hypothetical protein
MLERFYLKSTGIIKFYEKLLGKPNWFHGDGEKERHMKMEISFSRKYIAKRA